MPGRSTFTFCFWAFLPPLPLRRACISNSNTLLLLLLLPHPRGVECPHLVRFGGAVEQTKRCDMYRKEKRRKKNCGKSGQFKVRYDGLRRLVYAQHGNNRLSLFLFSPFPKFTHLLHSTSRSLSHSQSPPPQPLALSFPFPSRHSSPVLVKSLQIPITTGPHPPMLTQLCGLQTTARTY